MGRFVNSGNSAFQVALNSEIYVDKTGLLAYTNKVMDTTAKFICNSRPRRFGKSITADMLTAYYCKGCSSEEMFSSLEIGQAPGFTKYLNQYDVIHLDIQWCMEPAGGPENVVSYITEIDTQSHCRLRHARGGKVPLDVGSRKKPYLWIHYFSQVAMTYILEQATKRLPGTMICHEGLLELKKHDEENQTQYMETLRVYLEQHLSATQAARELFIHRSTFLYRLDRIREILQSDLDDPEEIFYLELSFRLLEQEEEKE